MPERPQYLDGDIFNPETHHEESDVNVRALLWFFVIFVVSAIVTHIALWFLYKGFVKMERRNAGAPLTAMHRPADASVPQNQPLLQPFPRKAENGEVMPPYRLTPPADVVDMRRAEQEALTSYGWIDQQKGVVRIPIAEAKKLLVQRGLPVQQTMPVTTSPSVTPQQADPNPARLSDGVQR